MAAKPQTGGARWALRHRAWNLQDRAADAAWKTEERLLWPARRVLETVRFRAARRAARSAEPIQRPVQTKVIWPLADAHRSGSPKLRTALLVAGVTAVLAAGAAASMLGTEGSAAPEPVAAAEPAPELVASERALRGAPPNFSDAATPASPAGAAEAGKAGRRLAASSPLMAGKPDPEAPPAEVALVFADAFVAYEVGKADEATARTFSAVADDPLAKALAGDPPRLPSGKKVPEAQVLNVVLGKPEGKQVEASVSLLRLRAASELRLTLHDTPQGWQVSEVLG